MGYTQRQHLKAVKQRIAKHSSRPADAIVQHLSAMPGERKDAKGKVVHAPNSIRREGLEQWLRRELHT